MGSLAMSLGALGNPVTGTQIVNTGVQATGAGVAAAASAGLLTTLGITAAAVPISAPSSPGLRCWCRPWVLVMVAAGRVRRPLRWSTK